MIRGLGKEGEDKEEGGEAEREAEVEGGSWDSQWQSLLSCLGSTIGPGVILRSPYFCSMYGGAAFLEAYTAIVGLLGLTLVFLELTMGQHF